MPAKRKATKKKEHQQLKKLKEGQKKVAADPNASPDPTSDSTVFSASRTSSSSQVARRLSTASASSTPSKEPNLDDSRASPGYLTRLSLASANSTPSKGFAARGEKIIISARVTPEGDIEVMISNDRPEAQVVGAASRKSQGDHVTAYINFLEMICIAVEGEEINTIPSRIQEIAISTLDEDKHDSFQGLLQVVEEKQLERVDREDRKELTALLRKLHKESEALEDVLEGKYLAIIERLLNEKGILKIKNSMKDGERLVIIDAIERVGTAFIETIQTTEGIAFEKTPKEDQSAEQKAASRAEGSRVKMASYGLRSFCRILSAKKQLETVDDVMEEKIVAEFFDDYNEPHSKLKSGIKQILPSEATQPKKGKRAKGQVDSTPQKSLEQWAQEIEKSSALENVGKLFGDMFDFSYEKHEDDDNPEQLLYKVTARHLVIMFIAFKQLQELSKEEQKIIIDSFLNTVLENQHWKKFNIVDEGGDENELTVEALEAGIKQHAMLGEKGTFRMLTKQDRDQERQRQKKEIKQQKRGSTADDGIDQPSTASTKRTRRG